MWVGWWVSFPNRNVINERFSTKLKSNPAVSRCKGKVGQHVWMDLRNREENGSGAASGGHHRLFGDTTDYFQIYNININIYKYPQILYYRGVFTTFRSLVSTGPWSIDTAEGQFRDDPDIRQYFKCRVCPPVSPVWIIFSFDTRRESKSKIF